MPWKESNIVEERLRFIARLLDGEKMAVVWSSAAESNHDFEGQSLASSPLDERLDVWYGWQESNLRTQPSQSCALFAELQP